MRRVILEFIGGAWDGMNLCNTSPDPLENRLAVQAYLATDNGAKGMDVVMPLDYAVNKAGCSGRHYVVTNRTQYAEDVLVRLEHLAASRTQTRKPSSNGSSASTQILLQFEGGWLDGLVLDSHSPCPNEALLSVACYCLTEHGTVGEKLQGIPPAWNLAARPDWKPKESDFRQNQPYRVKQRVEQPDQILVRFECHVKEPSSSPGCCSSGRTAAPDCPQGPALPG